MDSFPFEDELGDILQKARQGLGISICQLADRTGIPADLLELMESCVELPSLEQADRLAIELGLIPKALDALLEGRWELPPVRCLFPEFEIVAIRSKGASANCYVVGDRKTKDCFVVDPAWEGERVVETINSRGWKTAWVLLTHAHHDHTGGLRYFPGVPVCAGESEQLQVGPGQQLRRARKEGEIVNAGSLRIQVIQTAGHTEGSLCFCLPGAVFTGDTLFARSVGRASSTTLYRTLLHSVAKVLALPPETSVFPGHGPETIIGSERENNPFAGV